MLRIEAIVYYNLAEVHASRQLFAARGGTIPPDDVLFGRLDHPWAHAPNRTHRDIEDFDADLGGARQRESNLGSAGKRIREVPGVPHGKPVRRFDGKTVGGVRQVPRLVFNLDADVVRPVVQRPCRYKRSDGAAFKDRLSAHVPSIPIQQRDLDTGDAR